MSIRYTYLLFLTIIVVVSCNKDDDELNDTYNCENNDCVENIFSFSMH